ncbi:MAG: hypothetical protein WBG08_07215, partial [Litorimonas sp.]
TQTHLRPAAYVEAVAQTGTGLSEREVLEAAAAAEEHVLMGLRIEEGIDLSRLEAIRGEALAVDPALVEAGLLHMKKGRLAATPDGRMVLDALTRALLL